MWGANRGPKTAGHGQGHPEEGADPGPCKHFGLSINSLIQQIFLEQFPYVTLLAQVQGKCMPPKRLLSEIRETNRILQLSKRKAGIAWDVYTVLVFPRLLYFKKKKNATKYCIEALFSRTFCGDGNAVMFFICAVRYMGLLRA